MSFIYFLMTQELYIMDKYIVIDLDMFARNNKVYITDSQSNNLIGKYTIEELPEIISHLAHEKNIYEIRISGNSKFSQLLMYGIEVTEINKYNERKIRIEVI